MDPRLCIVTLGVADLERSKSFYLDGLGWSEVEQPSDGIVFIQMPGMVLALYPIEKLAEETGLHPDLQQCSGSVTLAYNTSSKQETDEVLTTAVGAGGKLVKAANDVFWGGYSGYFKDPDGHLWEVAYNPFAPLDEDGHLQMEAEADGGNA